MTPSFFTHFADLPDPRIERCRQHELLDIVFLAVCAVLSGADGWEAIEEFGVAKVNWLRRFVPLANGIPRHDTIARVLSRLDPEALQTCFIGWMQAVVHATTGDVIAIDGKTLRRSFDSASRKRALHMVSAWGCANGVVLGQVKTAEKSNEITAIPALLELLDVKGCIITIDAMGCQKDIATLIKAKRGEYVLAVKDNQRRLLDDIRDYFEADAANDYRQLNAQSCTETDSGHGRVEVRRCWQSSDLRWLPTCKEWPGLKSVARIECERHVGGKISREVRYYISSLGVEPTQLLNAVRSHWAIENSLHWVLDMTFREDESRVRRGDAAENLSTLRRMALNICKRNPTGKSNPSKIRCASWDDDFRERLLIGAGA